MVDAAAFLHLPPAQRAQMLYQQARADMSFKLWNAALGSTRAEESGAGHAAARGSGNMDLSSLLTLLTQPDQPSATPQPLPPPSGNGAPFSTSSLAWDARHESADEKEGSGWSTGLGPNAAHRATLSAAAARTGIPAEALAAIVNAEAAKGADGGWLSYSRNARSSAAGLGQFLNGTWKDEAERTGTWLNVFAQSQGWINAHGHVRSEAKSDLLALRYDARASIEAIADYARNNLERLKDAGIDQGSNVNGIARAAYFAHHLGVGDAIRFLKQGLDSHRAARLLAAQIGSSEANQRIAACGDAAQAHRDWLMDYVARRIRPSRFSAAFSA